MSEQSNQSVWRLILSGALRGAENMALDEALLQSVACGASVPILRLYRWEPATLTLGYGQRGSDQVNLAACKRHGVDVVRRCTGGRAVLHDREVTYAVISPEQNTNFPGGILPNYQVIAGVLQQMFHSFGIEAHLAPERSRGQKGTGAVESACFTAPGQFEILHLGYKLAGCAQKRDRGAFLQHGSIPVDLDLVKLFELLDTQGRHSGTLGAQLLGSKVGWLNRWLQTPVTIDEVELRLIDCFRDRLQITLRPSEPTADELELSRQLLRQRYANPLWNRLEDGAPSVV